MSDIKDAYNIWAAQYDTNRNKTRDLEALALRETLAPIAAHHCLEIGCGTGKNTLWLCEKAQRLSSVDFSEEMLALAKSKVKNPKVNFVQADITLPWIFAQENTYDLATFSLVLEHIENLDDIFGKLHAALKPGAYVYVGELHPFKQYSGTKARYESAEGIQQLRCYTHHISDFTKAASNAGFELRSFNEYFDEANNAEAIPRILALLFQKASS